jgi:hypothetical protein
MRIGGEIDMKMLIISLNNYEWIKYCSTLVSQNSNNCEVLVIRSQNEDPILGYPRLCEEARYEQRKEDLFRVGKELGLKKLRNLRYPKSLTYEHIERLAMELQLTMVFGAVSEVYFFPDKTILNIIGAIEKQLKHIKFYSYEKGPHKYDYVKRIGLTPEEIDKKRRLKDYMVGIVSEEDVNFPLLAERFFIKKETKKKCL